MIEVYTPKQLKYLEEIEKTKGKIDRITKERKLTCVHCKTRTPVSKMILIDDYYYVQPHGCTGGDYWTPSHYQLICPHCGESSERIYLGSFDTNYHTKEITEEAKKKWKVQMYLFIEAHKYKFGEVLKRYDKGDTLEELRQLQNK